MFTQHLRHDDQMPQTQLCAQSVINELKGSVKKKKFHNYETMRKLLVKPLTRQNISSCLVLPPEIIMHDAFNIL